MKKAEHDYYRLCSYQSRVYYNVATKTGYADWHLSTPFPDADTARAWARTYMTDFCRFGYGGKETWLIQTGHPKVTVDKIFLVFAAKDHGHPWYSDNSTDNKLVTEVPALSIKQRIKLWWFRRNLFKK